MLPVASGAPSRHSQNRWSVWTSAGAGLPTPAAQQPEELAELVRKNDLALSKLEPTTPGGPARFQDNRGTVYYEYDDDWVSTISPLGDLPDGDARHSRVSGFFIRNDRNSRALTGRNSLHPDAAAGAGSSSAAARRNSRRYSARKQVRSSWLPAPWTPFDRSSARYSVNPNVNPNATIAEASETSSRAPTERSMFSLEERDSDGSASGDEVEFLHSNRPVGGGRSRRPFNSVDTNNRSDPPSYPGFDGAYYPTDKKFVEAELPPNGFVPQPDNAFTRGRRSPWDDDAATINGDARMAKRSKSPPLPPADGEKQADGDDAVAPVHGWRLILMSVALAMAVFIVGVDVNIVATAIPEITADFGSVEDIGWYGSAFLLTCCAFQIPWGRLYTIFPAKWVFTSSTVIFEIGSLICAVAQDSIAFIVGRAVQGVGVAGILTGALIIMSLVVPLPKRSILGAVLGAVEGVAGISAPLIGGFLTDNTSWRWCFYINLPAGAAVLVVIIIFLNPPPSKRQDSLGDGTLWERTKELAVKVDVVGTSILVPAIIAVLLAMHWGGVKYDWDSLGIVSLFLIAIILVAFLTYIQIREPERAMVPSRILKQRSILAGFWFMLCTNSALVVISYFLPLWFQAVNKDSPSQSGVNMMPVILAVVVSVLSAGGLVSAIGYYAPFMIMGTIGMSVGAGLLSTLSEDTDAVMRGVYGVIFGIGIGFAFQQPVIAAQTVLPQEDIPLGTTVIVFGQTLGAALVVSIANSVFANRVTNNIKELLGPDTDLGSERILNGVTGGGETTDDTLKLISEAGASDQEITDALSKAITQSYYVALAMACLSIIGAIFIEWRSVKKAQPGNPNTDSQKQEADPEAARVKRKTVFSTYI